MKDRGIFAIGEDEKGIIATTTSSTFLRVQGDKVVADSAGTPSPTSTPYVFTMCANADGTQWYGTSDGLYFSRAGAPAALIERAGHHFSGNVHF